ncbi:MAG: HAMP domain-containing protein [Myxococcaceae bacterium]|nr:HAMP domain-containing protein [Myxococcaceae bacterium]
MGVRIAAIIALTTLASYLHLFGSLRDGALLQLEQHVTERSQREESIFVLAEDNHAVIKKALEERIRALSQEDPSARFDSLFVRLPDGTIRNRPEGFDGTKSPCLFVHTGVSPSDDLRRRILAAHDVLSQYGPAFHTRFTNTYIGLPENALVVYWPDRPTWCKDAEPTFSFISYELFTNTQPEHNPGRKTTYTGVFADEVYQDWMVSASAPLDMDGRHVAAVSHDILLKEMIQRTRNDHLPGAYNMLLRDDGQLIAHPELSMEGATDVYNILATAEQPGVLNSALGSAKQRAHLRALFEQVRNRESKAVLEIPEFGEYVAAAHLKGPGWNFVTVLPEREVSRPAFQAARYVLLLGVASLLIELIVMYLVLKQQITRPLQAFTQATDQVAGGDFKVALDGSRGDELGRLARAFRTMADEVQRREVSLKQANEGLEQRVEERTRELKEVHRRLVESARQAGMAEVATNVLHNVGNVLNSVQTAATLAKTRLSGMKLENVGRVANMLTERQGDDLALFLTQDERGRSVPTFLDRLGQHLRDERAELSTLLDDVNRYTEHIGNIVKLQQSYARPPRLHEPVLLAELIEDALRINSAGLSRHGVRVEKQLASLPPLLTDKHKGLMILVNLISNAKYALDEAPGNERILSVKVEPAAEGRVRIHISDTGVGIQPELLTRIFQYGFTTREEGHGFGLHASALAAQQLGGSLTAHSDGPGRGATFTLELPYQPAEA